MKSMKEICMLSTIVAPSPRQPVECALSLYSCIYKASYIPLYKVDAGTMSHVSNF